MTPRPFQLVAPGSLGPCVLSCEHASPRLPAGVRVDRALAPLMRSHWAWDSGAWDLARDLARRLETTAIGARYSRLWIDLNRRIDDPTLARAEAEGTALPWNTRLGARALEQRIVAYHNPYHIELDRLIQRRLVRGIRPLIFSVHSFTPVWEGRPRKFDVGLLYEHHQGPAQHIARHVRSAGFRVRYNEPYSGMAGMMYAVDRHGTHHGLPCLEIEVNDALLAQAAPTRRLAAAVAAGLRALVGV